MKNWLACDTLFDINNAYTKDHIDQLLCSCLSTNQLIGALKTYNIIKVASTTTERT